jgi:hypothetical protein
MEVILYQEVRYSKVEQGAGSERGSLLEGNNCLVGGGKSAG